MLAPSGRSRARRLRSRSEKNATGEVSYTRPFLSGLLQELQKAPMIGNVLKASVHPLYKGFIPEVLSQANQQVNSK